MGIFISAEDAGHARTLSKEIEETASIVTRRSVRTAHAPGETVTSEVKSNLLAR